MYDILRFSLVVVGVFSFIAGRGTPRRSDDFWCIVGFRAIMKLDCGGLIPFARFGVVYDLIDAFEGD